MKFCKSWLPVAPNLPVFNYGTKCSHIVITPCFSMVAYRSNSIKESFE